MRKRPLPLMTWQTTSLSVWLICFGLDFFVGRKAIRPLVNCFSSEAIGVADLVVEFFETF